MNETEAPKCMRTDCQEFRKLAAHPEIHIGPYKITPFVDGTIWISGEGGEGGQMSLESFDKMYKEWL